MNIRIYHKISDIKNDWLRLEAKALKALEKGDFDYIEFSYYQTFGWNEFLERSYGAMLSKRMDYFVAEHNGEVVMIVPMIVSKNSRKVNFLSGKIAGILNAICVSSDHVVEEAADCMVKFIVKNYTGYLLRFFDIPQQTPFCKALKNNGYAFTERSSYHVNIGRFGCYDEYIASLSKNIYKNIRKSYNHLVTDGKKMALEFYDSSNPVPVKLMRRIWKLYYTRKYAWKGRKVTALSRLICGARAIYEASFGSKSRSMRVPLESKVIVLTIDGQLAAFMHVYVHGKKVLMPKLAIDAMFSRYSPGILLLLETLRMLMDAGCDDFDMCRGDERYKREVGGENQPLARFVVNLKV